MNIRAYRPADEAAVLGLWEECGLVRAWNDPRKDIARKLAVQPELFLVGTHEDRIVASAMAGYDGHRGWVYYFAVSTQHRKRSFGRTLMREVERLLLERGCPKVNLQVRTSNEGVIDFFRKLGYTRDDAAGLGHRLIAD